MIAVPLVLHFLSHVVRCDVGHTALAADEYQLGLLEGRLTLYEYRSKAALVHLIHVTARLGAHLVQHITVAVLEHSQGEILACVYKLLGEAALADIAGRTRLAPHHADCTPACGHGVPLVLGACGNQHPLLTDQVERIERLFGNVDLLHDMLPPERIV